MKLINKVFTSFILGDYHILEKMNKYKVLYIILCRHSLIEMQQIIQCLPGTSKHKFTKDGSTGRDVPLFRRKKATKVDSVHKSQNSGQHQLEHHPTFPFYLLYVATVPLTVHSYLINIHLHSHWQMQNPNGSELRVQVLLSCRITIKALI